MDALCLSAPLGVLLHELLHRDVVNVVIVYHTVADFGNSGGAAATNPLQGRSY